MIDGLLSVLTFWAALGAALIAGVFFAFSAFVMTALARLPAAQGIAAMQSINVVVINPAFLLAFFGTAAACVLLVVTCLLGWHEANGIYVLVGSLLYLLGTILVTIMFNVPRNNRLAVADPASANGAGVWAEYVPSWTAWNHARTAAALAAAASLTMAL